MHEWAEQNKYRIVREFADDASGLDTSRRRDFRVLLEVCKRPKGREADVVLCYDVSRFSRLDPEEAASCEYSLRQAGVRVLYTHDPGANDSGLTGRIVKSVNRVLAHEYSQKLSQVVKRGLHARAERGDWTGGPPPYGYRRAVKQSKGSFQILEPGRWKAKGEQVSLVIDPVEADAIREIFEAYVNRAWGLAAIAHRLNDRGVPPPASLRRRGTAVWSKSTIWAILRNPAYRGALVYGKTSYREIGKKGGKVKRPEADRVKVEGAIPEIIPQDLWEKAQAKHTQRRFGVGRPWQRPYLLSALITCGHCGKKFQAHRPVGRKENAYYVCGGYVSSGLNLCDGLRVPMSYLDEAVQDGIHKRLERVLDRDTLRQRLRELLETDQPQEGAVEALQGRLADTRRQIDRIVAAIGGGTEELPSLRAALVRLEREREGLETELETTTARMTPGEQTEAIVETLMSAVSSSRETLDAGEPEERKALVRAFLRGIEIQKAARRAVLSWYRLPQLEPLDQLSVKLVAPTGFEPVFSHGHVFATLFSRFHTT